MRKKSFLLLLALASIAGKGYAQGVPCGTDEVRKKLLAQHPELTKIEADYERQIQAGLKKIDFNKAARVTAGGDGWYDVPIVVHIVHDYNAYQFNQDGGDYATDDNVFNSVKSWNITFAGANPDTSEVIPPFKKYVGNPKIRLRLASIDPSGNPTKGITRHRSYLTYNGGESAKFDDWNPTSYVNIWLVNVVQGNAGIIAYATPPASGAVDPAHDGIIGKVGWMSKEQVIPHEMGHIMNLMHTWGNTNNPELECGDDNVDDTPPTKGHQSEGCVYNNKVIYDTACCQNYYKTYIDDSGHVTLVNYPDTANSQNIMDYTECQKMFSKGQVARMSAALENSVAGRNNLWSPGNLALTGALADRPDLKPIPDFLVSPVSYSGYMNKNANFVFPNTQQVKFINESWNDTITNVTWNFSNGADKTTDTARTVTNKFSEGGWAQITMTVRGNNTGDTSHVFDHSVFIADPNAKDPNGYIQDFDAAGDRDKWPTFNYYNNSFKWQLSNVGMYDNASMMYTGFDAGYNPSTFTYPSTGNPKGDFDDLFTAPMNLTGTSYLNFYYASASRSALGMDISDTMTIDYSTGSGVWTNLVTLGKGDLINNGSLPTAFAPTYLAQWSPKNIALPASAQKPYVAFRFRYKPGIGADGFSSGNNFYLDRIYFSNIPAGVNEAAMANVDVAVVPNPTHGNAYVIVKDANNATAKIVVSDITGKVVYTTSEQVSGNTARIEIPRSVIAVSGVYMVQTTTGSQSNTQKLVVY